MPQPSPIRTPKRGRVGVGIIVPPLGVDDEHAALVELLRSLDRRRFAPHLACLGSLGPLQDVLAGAIPVWQHLQRRAWDPLLAGRLARWLRHCRAQVSCTVIGSDDPMAAARLAAWSARIPRRVAWYFVHRADAPRRWFPRRLLRLEHACVAATAAQARRVLLESGLSESQVHVAPLGLEVQSAAPRWPDPRLREQLRLPPEVPVVGTLAELAIPYNVELFLRTAARIRRRAAATRFLIAGEGPLRRHLEHTARELGIASQTCFVDHRGDAADLLALMDVVLLTPEGFTSPWPLARAMAAARPIVGTRCGPVADWIRHGQTGLLSEPHYEEELARHVLRLLHDRELATRLGEAGRCYAVEEQSLQRKVAFFEGLFAGASLPQRGAADSAAAAPQPMPQPEVVAAE